MKVEDLFVCLLRKMGVWILSDIPLSFSCISSLLLVFVMPGSTYLLLHHPEWMFQWHDLDILAFLVGFALLDFCLGIIVAQRSMSITSLMICCRMVGFEVLFSKFIGLALLEIFRQADHFLFWLIVLMVSMILIYMLAVISRFTASEAQGSDSHP
ncbi:hypothetical protein [Holdemania massiliensis]|uniref:hypothetical protein n=1 Tax=Holdemania massiliensis TaxID=1468449 RepID=UPI001F0587C3|nr:hypothetical protein [Holdemania massiliensis]MCH1940909.1 hypothetical protein [Holdemania massiliensis]